MLCGLHVSWVRVIAIDVLNKRIATVRGEKRDTRPTNQSGRYIYIGVRWIEFDPCKLFRRQNRRQLSNSNYRTLMVHLSTLKLMRGGVQGRRMQTHDETPRVTRSILFDLRQRKHSKAKKKKKQ